LFKKKVGSNISSAGKWPTGVIRVFEITSVNQEITVLTQGMVEEMMITVSKRIVFLWEKGVQVGCVLIEPALDKLEALAGRIFFSTWFIVGTIPTANRFNGGSFLMIHSRTMASCQDKTRPVGRRSGFVF